MFLVIEFAIKLVLAVLFFLVALIWLMLPVAGILLWIFFGPFVVVATIVEVARLIFSFIFLFFRKKYRKGDDEIVVSYVDISDAENQSVEAANAEASDVEEPCAIAPDAEVV